MIYRYFRSEDSQASYLVIPVGNVTAETELTYEYGVRNKSNNPTPPSSEGQKVPQLMIDGKPHLLFQLQIEYTGRDGSRCMRVITEAKPITRDRKEAERGGGNEEGEKIPFYFPFSPSLSSLPLFPPSLSFLYPSLCSPPQTYTWV